MNKTVVINVVALTDRILKETVHLRQFAEEGTRSHVRPVLPAVTCPVQATYLTGRMPASHGIVGNGWYFSDLCEVGFWKQSNKLVQGEKIWDAARKLDPRFTCANLFWWFNMYGGADFSVTPRPLYPASGRKIPDIYTFPAGLREDLKGDLGHFPLFNFWGPRADILFLSEYGTRMCPVPSTSTASRGPRGF